MSWCITAQPYFKDMGTSRCLLVKVTLPFSCFLTAGVEKKNNNERRNFDRKINRWDPCASLLTVEK